jgi:uncharacterized phage infection (PIP) family protein YhgE
MSDGKTEVEFAGVKFRGGKLFVIITLLSTLGGAIYAGFEFYKDYANMRTKIEKYVKPDLSGFDKRIAVMEQTFHKEMRSLKSEVVTIKESVITSTDYTRDIKNDLKQDLQTLEATVDDVERRGKEAFKLVRESIDKNDTKVRTMITSSSDRFDKRRESLRTEMVELERKLSLAQKGLETRINNIITKTLKNPLSKLRGGGR